MARLIVKSHYLKKNKSAGNYLQYIATRDGVIKIAKDLQDKPATSSQKLLIDNFIKADPKIKDSIEYATYKDDMTMGNASELISSIEETWNEAAVRGIEGYVSYIASRPNVTKIHTNGLFSDSPDPVKLDVLKRRLNDYDGIVFTPIVSLRREDADKLGYNNPKAFQDLIKAHRNELAKAYQIDPDNFEWYGAFHNEPSHPHIHLVFFSKDGKQGYQTQNTWSVFKRAMAKDIFRQDLTTLYVQKDLTKNVMQSKGKTLVDEVVERLYKKDTPSDNVEILMKMLSERLKDRSGKLVYGYLPKEDKVLVDNIVNELAKDGDIKQLLDEWFSLKGNLNEIYTSSGYAEVELSEIPEFKPLKNYVIKCASQLNLTVIDNEQQFGENEVYKYLFINIATTFRHLLMAFNENNNQGNSHNDRLMNKKDMTDEINRRISLGIKG